jgi:hypothetical protein
LIRSWYSLLLLPTIAFAHTNEWEILGDEARSARQLERAAYKKTAREIEPYLSHTFVSSNRQRTAEMLVNKYRMMKDEDEPDIAPDIVDVTSNKTVGILTVDVPAVDFVDAEPAGVDVGADDWIIASMEVPASEGVLGDRIDDWSVAHDIVYAETGQSALLEFPAYSSLYYLRLKLNRQLKSKYGIDWQRNSVALSLWWEYWNYAGFAIRRRKWAEQQQRQRGLTH